MIHDRVAPEKKEFYYFLNKTNYNNFKEHSLKTKFWEFINAESVLSKKRHLAVKSKID